MIKDQDLPNKIFEVITAQENHFQIAITISDHNPLIETITAEDLQTEGRSPNRSRNYSINRPYYKRITLGVELTTTYIDKGTTLSHHIEIILNTQFRTIRTTEIVHQNIKDKLIKCSQQKTFKRTLPVLTMQENQNYS